MNHLSNDFKKELHRVQQEAYRYARTDLPYSKWIAKLQKKYYDQVDKNVIWTCGKEGEVLGYLIYTDSIEVKGVKFSKILEFGIAENAAGKRDLLKKLVNQLPTGTSYWAEINQDRIKVAHILCETTGFRKLNLQSSIEYLYKAFVTKKSRAAKIYGSLVMRETSKGPMIANVYYLNKIKYREL